MTTPTRLTKLDSRPIPTSPGEIRAFVCIKNEKMRLPFFLDYHRRLGVDRFFFIDNGSDDGTLEFVMGEADCHCFNSDGNYFAENIAPPPPPRWSNTVLNVFGDGYWTLTLDADELLVYPHCEEVTLRRLCEHLDDSGFDALLTLMVDMYGDEPLMKAHYSRGQSFLEACPYFDPEIGPTNPVESLYSYPSYQVFSPVRQRAFWHGKNKAKLPPCINKVPLVRWRKGMAYLVSNHFISYAKLSNLQGGLLHFKFLAGFFESSLTHVKDNSGFREKALEERSFYVDTLAKNPNLSLKDSRSVRYHNSTQLIDLGWMKTSPAYEAFVGFQVVGA